MTWLFFGDGETPGMQLPCSLKIPADIRGQYCSSYEHIGQHGAADYYGVIQDTTPVGPRECVELAEELRRIGYNLRPIKRASWRNHGRRRQIARHLAAVDTDRIASERN